MKTHVVLTIVDISLNVASNRSHTSSTTASSSSSSKSHTPAVDGCSANFVSLPVIVIHEQIADGVSQ
jgi:hypothetical protein